MAGFKIVRDDRNKGATKLTATSIVVTSGDLLELVHGETSWALATGSSVASTRKAIAIETIASSATGVVSAIILDGTELVSATTDHTTSANHNGDGMIIGTGTTGAQTIDNTGTTVASSTSAQQFVQYKPDNTKDTTTVLGYILVGDGVLHAAS